jgi:hypothetical protein
MRKLILIAAIVLISACAQAGATRGLILAANNPPPTAVATADQPKTDQTKTDYPLTRNCDVSSVASASFSASAVPGTCPIGRSSRRFDLEMCEAVHNGSR